MKVILYYVGVIIGLAVLTTVIPMSDGAKVGIMFFGTIGGICIPFLFDRGGASSSSSNTNSNKPISKNNKIQVERFCPKCGKKYPSDAVFCADCGEKLQ